MSSNRPLGRMLVSKERGRVVEIDPEKVARGSFFTDKSLWLTNEVAGFLIHALEESKGFVLDPFAGDGHLLEAVKNHPTLGSLVSDVAGFDIDSPHWPINDSLKSIPNPNRAVILTNPPYLANHSARRKGVLPLVGAYFKGSERDNLYKIALDGALAASEFVVAVLPEAFLLSSYSKQRLQLAVVIEGQLFSQTEAPAVVACFSPEESFTEVFIGDKKIGSLQEIMSLRKPKVISKKKVRFNVSHGRIGLRAVDGASGKHPIEFLLPSDFAYSNKRIKESSRLMTYLEIAGLGDDLIEQVIEVANAELTRIREASSDLVLAPFKGNDKSGRRRRRLDYALARRILLAAIDQIESER